MKGYVGWMQPQRRRLCYQVPEGTAEFSQVIRNSRFIAFCGFASTVSEAGTFIAGVRLRYPDATHHAWAYKVNAVASIIGASDDGEPGGTAGRPILAVLEGTELDNVVVVVARYFGGIKLGPGGLVRAYSDTARQALKRVKRATYTLHTIHVLHLDYSLYQKMVHLARRYDCRLVSADFGTDVTLRLAVPYCALEAMNRELADMSAGHLSLGSAYTGEEYLAAG